MTSKPVITKCNCTCETGHYESCPMSVTAKRGKRWVLHTGAMNQLIWDIQKAVADDKYMEWLKYHFPKYRKYYREVELCPKKQ